jgi:hypothetical protein
MLFFFLLLIKQIETTDLTNWHKQPATAVETVAAGLLQLLNISVCHVYDALAVRNDLHMGGNKADCTHFGVNALLFMTEAVLQTAVGMM